MAAPFVNWSRTVTATPAERHTPDSEEQILEILDRARAAGRRVKAVGSGHSFSAIAVTDGVLLDLGRMNGVLSFDAAARRITVQAGMRLHDLNARLKRAGFTLPILGSITEQHVAGAIATGTHGSSLSHGNLSSLVTAIRLIAPTGAVLDLGEGDESLAGARVHLGALGIVTRVTLRMEPAFLLEEETSSLPFTEAVRRLPELARSAEYVKLWWLPHVQTAQLYQCRRHPGPPTFSPRKRRLDEIVNARLFPAALRFGAAAPGLVPRINALIARAYFQPRRTIGRVDEILTVAMPPVHREAEYAVPLARGADLLSGIDELIRRQGLRVNFPVEARFVRGDDGWLSPAAGRDSCQIGVYMADCPDLERYFAGCAALARELGGRPHWGKEFAIDWDEVRRLWPDADRFRALCRTLDPEGVMRNKLLDQVLGPP